MYNIQGPGGKNSPQKRVYRCMPVSDGPYRICKKKVNTIMSGFPVEIFPPKKGYTSVYLAPDGPFLRPFLGSLKDVLNPYNTRVYEKIGIHSTAYFFNKNFSSRKLGTIHCTVPCNSQNYCPFPLAFSL